jgi:hypothetical protein
MRALLVAVLAVMFLGCNASAQSLQLALDGAADLSPVYPTLKIPANAGQFVAIFTFGDQKRHKIETAMTPIEAVGSYTINPQGQTEVIAAGDGTRALMRYFFQSDLPVGRWRLTVKLDGKPFAAQEFSVVPAAAPLQLHRPLSLAGSLTKGSEWTSEVRALQEIRPGIKISLGNVTKADANGWLHTTAVSKVIALTQEGAQTDNYRGGMLVNSIWTIVTDKGLAIAKFETAGHATVPDPPQLILAWPLKQFHTSWRWHDKRQKPEFGDQFQMWGPLPVKTPDGEAPGYVVLQKTPADTDATVIASSSEIHIVPGLGTVYSKLVQPIPQYRTAIHIESSLISMKHGSGPEPEMRPYGQGTRQ